MIEYLLKYISQQKGGGSCSLCESPNATKTTCPLNPNAKNPNPAKHPLAKVQKKVKKVSKQVKSSSNVFTKIPVSKAKPLDKTFKYKGKTYSIKDENIRPAYIPTTKEIKKETGLEQKFGGTVPYFTKGDTWPLDWSDTPLVFVGQFLDPTNNSQFKNKLIQIWSPPIEEIEDAGVEFKLIDLGKPLKKIIITPPKNYTPYSKAEEITKWVIKDEVDHNLFAYDMFNEDLSDEDSAVLLENVIWIYDKYSRHNGEKVEGFGESCQNISYKEFIHNLWKGKWGDAGYIHLSEDNDMEGDMC